MESLWRKQTNNIPTNKSTLTAISDNQAYDIIVIGAGLAGILIAFYLQEQGKKVLILEADEIASGQSERTTAKITSQHGLKYDKLMKDIGVEGARLYARANEAAIKEYEQLIEQLDIDCQFEKLPAYLYTLLETEPLKREAQAASTLGIDAYFTQETELPFPVTGAVCFRNQAQFFPLKFMQHISAKLQILEHTKVIKIKGNRVITEDRAFGADKIVVATHYPLLNLPGFYFLRQHQERSYCLALSGCGNINGMYYGIDQDGLSFRQAGDYLILGGGSHRTGENTSGGKYDYLFQKAKQYFPDCREEARWSAQDCMPHDGIPFIGKYSLFTPHLYIATGFQKWGMASSMLAALILRDELCGFTNPYASLFSPQRLNFRAGLKNLLSDMAISIKGLLKGWLGKPSKRCPHMGCALTWNPDEESWDCPCHGSRFDKSGNLLDNPAKIDKR